MAVLGTRDVAALLDIVGTMTYDRDTDAFSEPTLRSLCELLGADWITYLVKEAGHAGSVVEVEVGTRPFPGHCVELERVFRTYQHENPLCAAQACPASGVLLVGDVVTRRNLCRTAWYNEWCREVHVQPQAKVFLTDSGSGFHRRRSLMIDHADDAARSFGRRERMILELVRPSFVRVVEEADAARARYRVLGVTRREVEVLALVREGLTNGEIASKLFIAPTTVRSHLENAFAKLGAHTRTEAVAHLARLHPHRYTAKRTPTRDDVEPAPIQLRL